MGQNAVATKRSVPPSGNSAAIVSPAISAGAPSTTAALRSSPPGRAPANTASAPTHTYTPATGLAHALANASTAAAARARGRHAHAPTANAIPSANGIRPTTRLLTAPLANSHVAIVAARGVGAMRSATTENDQTAATVAITPTSRVPTSAASGGYSSE